MSIDDDLLLRDIDLPEDPDASLVTTPTGDLRLVSGRANLRAALRRRVVTNPGEMTHRPEYGAGLPLYVESADTPTQRAQLANGTRRNLLQDARLSEVRVAVSAVQDRPHAVVVELDVRLATTGDDEQFSVLYQG